MEDSVLASVFAGYVYNKAALVSNKTVVNDTCIDKDLGVM